MRAVPQFMSWQPSASPCVFIKNRLLHRSPSCSLQSIASVQLHQHHLVGL